MVENAIGFSLLLIGLISVALQRLFSTVPVRELKRLATKGDALAAVLYRVAAYGTSLRLLLWIIVGISLSVGLLLTTTHLPMWAGLAVLLFTAFSSLIILPSIHLSKQTAQLAAFFVPTVVWMLRHTHRLLEMAVQQTNRFRDLSLQHSRLYEKEDLLELIQRQKEQGDNRIHHDDLSLAEQALLFGDIRAADIVLPRKQAYLVNADDNIGPILLDQLHKQKQQSFLVYKDEKENIIGSLALADAVTAKKGGRVFDLIRSDLIFVHEDFTARQVLNAFHKTNHQVAVVINNAEEFIGVITLNHLLHTLLGEVHDEDVSYGDRGAVAAYRPKPGTEADQPQQSATAEQKASTEDSHQSESASSPEATEVVK